MVTIAVRGQAHAGSNRFALFRVVSSLVSLDHTRTE